MGRDSGGVTVKKSIQAICRIAMFAALVEAQELAFLALPNIQLTQLLIVVFTASFGFVEGFAMVTCYWLLDNTVMGSFSVTYSPAMLAGWLLLVGMTALVYRFIVKKPDGIVARLVPALFTALHAFLYCWGFMVVSCTLYHMPWGPYFASDLPFELALAATGFVTVFLLSPTLIKLLKKLKKQSAGRESPLPNDGGGQCPLPDNAQSEDFEQNNTHET